MNILIKCVKTAVLTAIGFVLTLSAIFVITPLVKPGQTPYEKSMFAIYTTRDQILEFRRINGFLPETLDSLPQKQPLRDAGGRPLRYELLENEVIKLSSLGEDNRVGGVGENEDIKVFVEASGGVHKR